MSDTIRFLKLTPDGTLTEGQAPARGSELMHRIYAEIGCDYFDCVRLGETDDGFEVSMYVDDNGLVVEDAEVNDYATLLVSEFNGGVHQPYAGVVLLLGPVDRHGNDTSLSDEMCERIGTFVNRHAVKEAQQ